MARKLKLDMTNVESYTLCEEGIHTAKIAKIEETTSQAGDDMLKTTFEVVKGDSKGCKVFENFVLTEKAMWKLKSCLEAMGIKCDGKISIDLDKLTGRVVDIDVFHEEYNGRDQAKIANYSPASGSVSEDDDDDDEEDEVEETPKTKAKPADKKAGKKKPEPEPEEDEDDEDWDDEDEDEDEVEEEPAPKKSAKKPAPAKKAATKKPAPKKKPEPEDDDDDDEDWEED